MKNLPTIESETGSDLNQGQQLLTRLQRLSDGIFMLAMMLMVLQFDLPDLKKSTPYSLTQSNDLS
ncbi:hypothetical protein [Roseofilum sp. Guam]|uniref:hypothetical protein n=1 Tax=Roseofilum sp. Guam TaxID=2821502 RepID=UPI001B1130E5|nr:hypothetical protein [Roseofilum sp. Guam]MBP0030415.1 hypothetical protein [Roseofilum sp. Guam]